MSADLSVGAVCQDNSWAYFLHEIVPAAYRKADDTCVSEEDLEREANIRGMLQKVGIVAALPSLFLATNVYIYSGVAGFAAGTIVGAVKQARNPGSDGKKSTSAHFRQATIILRPDVASMERSTELMLAVSNVVCSVVSPATSAGFSGFCAGVAHSGEMGRMLGKGWRKLAAYVPQRAALPTQPGESCLLADEAETMPQ